MCGVIKDIISHLEKDNREEEGIINKEFNVNKSIFKNSRLSIIEANKLINSDSKILIRKHTRYIDFPKHKHDFIEFNYVLQGNITQIINNQKVVLKKGDLIFLGQDIEHEIKASKREDIMLNFIIQPKFFDYIFKFINNDIKLYSFFINSIIKEKSSKAFVFKVSNNPEIQNNLIEIIKLWNEKENIKTIDESKIKLLLALCILNLSEITPKIITKNSYEEQIISSVFEYIENNFKTASLNDISKILNLKNYNLSKLIKKECNLLFKDLVQEMKLKKFCELLTVNDLSIQDLADRVGFHNSSYFYKIFKKKYNITPKEYREQLIIQEKIIYKTSDSETNLSI